MHFANQVTMRLISQLIKGISRVSQILLKYFNGTGILKSFVLQLAEIFPVVFVLDSNDSEFVKVAFGSSLKYCHKPPDIFE